jgi:hypothetical protein
LNTTILGVTTRGLYRWFLVIVNLRKEIQQILKIIITSLQKTGNLEDKAYGFLALIDSLPG